MLLNFGGTPVAIVLAGTSWAELGAQYMAAIAELEGILAQVQGMYVGPSADQFVAAHTPMLAWFTDVAAKAEVAAAAHAEIAGAYTAAVAAMPTLGELIENHSVHGILIGTNFFGVNTIPIALNEFDYERMWVLAADVMTGWDSSASFAADSIPLTPVSPIVLMPGVGEAGNAAATAAAQATLAEGQIGGAALTGSDLMSSKLLAGKAATSPFSAADGGSSSLDDPAGGEDLLQSGSVFQQVSSIGPQAAQSVMSATQSLGPQQLLQSAPRMLSSAPQTLSQMMTQFSGQSMQPTTLGFAGTSAMGGYNPAGMTRLAGGAFGTGPARPLLPSTWGASPTTATEAVSSSRGASIAPAVMSSAASPSGAGGMMAGANGAGANRGQRGLTSYADTTLDEDAAERSVHV